MMVNLVNIQDAHRRGRSGYDIHILTGLFSNQITADLFSKGSKGN